MEGYCTEPVLKGIGFFYLKKTIWQKQHFIEFLLIKLSALIDLRP
jgi:hypothetical protein